LREDMVSAIGDLFPASAIPPDEGTLLRQRLNHCSDLIPQFASETLDGFLYTRLVTCPHCHGEAPLLNTMWLSKEAADPWGVKVITYGQDSQGRRGKVRFQPYRIKGGKGPNGEDPNLATVTRGVGQCVHCRQAIEGDEIKRQARGESELGKWQDWLYAVVAVRFEPKLDSDGQPQRYGSGGRSGEIKTKKVRFFRPPKERDLEALAEAEKRLAEQWPEWEAAGLIPTERLPDGQKTSEPLRYGMPRWCDLFTPRQLLGHLYLVEGLNRLKLQMLKELGEERGRAVATYLQFAIDKGLDYNSRQTRWEGTGSVLLSSNSLIINQILKIGSFFNSSSISAPRQSPMLNNLSISISYNYYISCGIFISD